MNGPDHKASANQTVLREEMVDEIQSRDNFRKFREKPIPSEMKIRFNIRKSLVALNNIKKGEVFSYKNIGIKRPGIGLPPKYLFKY